MDKSPSPLKYLWLYLGGVSISLAVSALLLLFLKPYINSIDRYTYWVQVIGLMIALSVIGKNIQLVGWLLFTIGSGVHTAFFANYDGPLAELGAWFCTIAILLEIAVMIFNGRKKSLDSDEWLIAAVSFAQLLTMAFIRAWFL